MYAAACYKHSLFFSKYKENERLKGILIVKNMLDEVKDEKINARGM